MVAALMRPNPLYPPLAQPTFLGMTTDVPPLLVRASNASTETGRQKELDVRLTERNE
jgi:hypothetical protein